MVEKMVAHWASNWAVHLVLPTAETMVHSRAGCSVWTRVVQRAACSAAPMAFQTVGMKACYLADLSGGQKAVL